MSTRSRRLLALLVTSFAMLLFSGTAQAAPNWSTSTLSSTGPYVAGGTATYTLDIVNTGTAPATPNSVYLGAVYPATGPTVVGTPTVTDGPGAGADMSAQVTTTPGSNAVLIKTGFGLGDARVTFTVQLPTVYDANYRGRVAGTVDGATLDVVDVARELSKGGPSAVVLDAIDPYPISVAKGSTYPLHVRVTNRGTGSAEYVHLTTYASGTPSVFSITPPAFVPTATFTTGCPAVSGGGSTCDINSIAAGASVDLVVLVDALTHYGSLSVSIYASHADAGPTNSTYRSLSVTDGGFADTSMTLFGPVTGAGGADLTYAGALRNDGPSPLGTSQLRVEATGFNAAGSDITGSDQAHQLDSIKSITLSTGGACAKFVDTTVVPNVTHPNMWICPVAGLPVGGSISYSVVANFPVHVPNSRASVNVRLDSVTGTYDGYASQNTALDVDRTSTMALTMTGPKVVGAGRIAQVRLTVQNTGNTDAFFVAPSLKVPGVQHPFDEAHLPAGCSHEYSATVTCVALSLPAGQSASWLIPVRAPEHIGTPLVMTANPGEWVAQLSGVSAGDWSLLDRAFSIDVVAPALVPFPGVLVAKPKVQSLAQLVKSGAPSVVTCPVACRVKGELRVPRAVATRLGLVAAAHRRAKALPYVVIGTGTRSMNAAGKVTVVVKLSRAYKAKVAKLRAPLVVSRVLTVTSTEAGSKDASTQKVRALTFRPARGH